MKMPRLGMRAMHVQAVNVSDSVKRLHDAKYPNDGIDLLPGLDADGKLIVENIVYIPLDIWHRVLRTPWLMRADRYDLPEDREAEELEDANLPENPEVPEVGGATAPETPETALGNAGTVAFTEPAPTVGEGEKEREKMREALSVKVAVKKAAKPATTAPAADEFLL